MTTEANNSERDPRAEDDEFSEGAPAGVPVREPREPDVAVLELPPGAVQFPTSGDFTLAGFQRDVTPLIRHLLQPKWLMVIAPLTLLYLYVIVRMGGREWFYFGSPLLFQPFVPLLTIWLIWRRRGQVMRQYYELAFVFPEDSPKRRGKIWPLLISVLIMGFAAIVQMTQLTVIGLVLSIFGAVYYLYGFFQLRSLWQMMAFLVLMIPPPIGTLARVTVLLQLGQTALAAMVAKIVDSGAEVREKILLHLTASNLMITPALCGVTVVVPVVVLTIWLAVLRRIPVLTTLALIVIGFLMAVVGNTLRVLTLGFLGQENPNPWVLEITNWVVVGLCFFLTSKVATRLTARRVVAEEEEGVKEEETDELTADLDVLLRGETAAETAAPTTTPAKDNR